MVSNKDIETLLLKIIENQDKLSERIEHIEALVKDINSKTLKPKLIDQEVKRW